MDETPSSIDPDRSDPLAPWRPEASWPEDERALWQQHLDAAGGDDQRALAALSAEAAETDRVAPPAPAYRPWAILLRLQLASLGEDHPDTLTALNILASRYCLLVGEWRALPLYEELLAKR